MYDADKGEKLLRNLARRLEKEAPGVAGSILEGIDDILTVTRLGLPDDLAPRGWPAAISLTNMMGTIRRVTGNVPARFQHALSRAFPTRRTRSTRNQAVILYDRWYENTGKTS